MRPAPQTLWSVGKPSDLSQKFALISQRMLKGHLLITISLYLSHDESKAEHHAWDVVHEQFEQDENGIWSKSKMTV